MQFHRDQKVMFKHCDPAGIVFYPRYFEMINDTVELFFADVLDWPFEAMHKTAAVPTVAIETEFTAPSRHGDMLLLTLTCTRLGTTSMGISITANCKGQTRFTATLTLVHIGPNGSPRPWPGKIQQKLQNTTKGHTHAK